jgi:hypothetical protein
MKNNLYSDDNYVNYKICYNSIIKHIINPNLDNYTFDIFCHCWHPDLQKDIINLYSPLKYEFEDNGKYTYEILNLCKNLFADFSGISQALTIKKSIELKEKYENENNIKYDIVILYRYDVFLWKDIILSNYEKIHDDYIYVSGDNDNDDLHFIMNNHNSYLFKYLYDSLKLGNHHEIHNWIKNYVINYIKKNIIPDYILAGIHQDVLRKITEESIKDKKLTMEQLNSYI